MIVNFQPCELQTNRFEYMTSLHTEMEDFGIILRIIVWTESSFPSEIK